MSKLALKKGVISVGLIVLILLGLTVATTIAINASPQHNGRKISVDDIGCLINHDSNNCPQESLQPNAQSQVSSSPQSFTPSKNGPCFPLGDAYKDSLSGITDKDAQIILEHAAGNYTDSAMWNPLGADVNGDGTIDPVDAQLIRQYLTGQINTFPACELIINIVHLINPGPRTTPIPNPSKPVPCGFYGDIAGKDHNTPDGKIDLYDVNRVYHLSVGGGFPAVWSDVNGDSKINPPDAKLVLQYIRGEVSTFPVCSKVTPGTTFHLQASKGPALKVNFSWSGGSVPAGTTYSFKVDKGDCNQENSTVYAGLLDYVKPSKIATGTYGYPFVPVPHYLPWPPKGPVSTLFYSSNVTRTPGAQLIDSGFGSQGSVNYCAGIYNSSQTLLSNAFYFTFPD